MKLPQTGPKKHAAHHGDILNLCVYCIRNGISDPKAAAYEILDKEWLSRTAEKATNTEKLFAEVLKTWPKALAECETVGEGDDKKFNELKKFQIAKSYVSTYTTYDDFTQQHLRNDKPTSPSVEYAAYNDGLKSEKQYIEKHHFVNAFEADVMPHVHTLKSWAQGLPKWDKRDWIGMLCKHIPAKDAEQCKQMLTGWLIRSYIQAINPNEQAPSAIVNRWFLILHQTKQASGKSSFFRWLLPSEDWVKQSGIEEGKDGFIALARYFFILDDELSGLFNTRQQERLKSMISASKVDVRLPYGKVDVSLPRVASFCGSTNSDSIFSGSDGTTRFLVVELKNEGFSWKKYTKEIDRTKLWAQVKHLALNTKWLDKNTPAIERKREEVNTTLVRESIEDHAITRYFEPAGGETVLTASDVMQALHAFEDLGKLNLNKLGSALAKRFGERTNGYTIDGERRKGYKIKLKSSGSLNSKIVTQSSDSKSKPTKSKKAVSKKKVKSQKKR